MENPQKYFAGLTVPRVERTRNIRWKGNSVCYHSLARHLQLCLFRPGPGATGALLSGVGAGRAARLSAGEVVSIEGEAIRHSRQAGGKAIVHMVSPRLSLLRVIANKARSLLSVRPAFAADGI